jgi:membrane-bound ClpP family serine protease
VRLPIDGRVAEEVKQSIDRIVDRTAAVVRPEARPTVVLEFETNRGKTGSGSQFEACVAIARYLVSPALNRINTVAYVPAAEARDVETKLVGHAVLVAICTNQIAMDEGTKLGNAGIDEMTGDSLMVDVYRSIAAKRRLMPASVALGMLDPDRELFRVQTSPGLLFVDSRELAKLEAAGSAEKTTTLAAAGALALIDAQSLFEDRLIQILAQSRTDLARQLNLNPGALEGDPTEGRQWQAVSVKLPPRIDARTASWVIRSLNQELASGDVNLVIFEMDGVEGDVDACLRLARYLSEFDSAKIRTAVHGRQTVRGPAAVFALAADHLIMADDATLGGMTVTDEPNESGIDIDRETFEPSVIEIARQKQIDWSVMLAMLDPGVSLGRYRHRDTGQIRLLTTEELATVRQPKRWAFLGEVDTTAGIDARSAQQWYLARSIANNADQVRTFYQLSSDVPMLQKSDTDVWIENVASFLSSPMVAPWLLFGAMFFFSSELSAPGLGVPGFLSAVCVMLFFWSNYLDGNADAVEILLFIVGLVFVLIEVFVVPGFGAFGIGGLAMVVASIILASQTFFLPGNAQQLAQLPRSLMPVLAAGLGFFVALFMLRKVLPNSPYLNRLILDSRRKKSVLDEEVDSEAVVDWSYLAGRHGKTVTRLNPSGKAKIDGEVFDVISRGQMIDKGEQVIVVEAVANRVVVAMKQNDDGSI